MPKDREAIVPERYEKFYSEWHYSPAHRLHDTIYVSGHLGRAADGDLPSDPSEQIRNAFRNVGMTLEVAGSNWADVVDMTTYHVGLQGNLSLIRDIRDEFVEEPYPAWTGIGITELAVPGAIIEIRATAVARRDITS